MKLKHELAFYFLIALALVWGNLHTNDAEGAERPPPQPCAHFCHHARGTDSLTIISGPQAIAWTGNLLTLRWGTHQIEFEAETQDNWTVEDSLFAGDMDEVYDPWTIDVLYNHRFIHIPERCSVSVTSHLGMYDVVARCRGE